MRPWLDRILQDTGPLELYDAHTHIGQNDPDGYKQTPDELLAALAPVDARAVLFPMHEPDGYPAANDVAIGAAAEHPDRLVAFCRVSPHDHAIPEARRALDAGAVGIKLHPRAEQFGMDEPVVGELVALAHERRLPMLIHAGPRDPGARPEHRPARRALPGRHADPRPRRDLGPRLAVEGAARPSERPDRHLVVEPRRPRRAVRAGAARVDRVGERLALRPPDREHRDDVALRAPGRAVARAGPRRRGRDPRARDRRASGPPTSGRRPASPTAPSTCCSSGWWSTCRARSRGSPPRRTRTRRSCSRGSPARSATDGPHADVHAAVLDSLDRYEAELAPPPPGVRFPVAMRHLIQALVVARTPDVPLPPLPGAPEPTRAEAGA